MEQRTLNIGDRIIYCYEDGSVEYSSRARQHAKQPSIRTFGYDNGRGYKRIVISLTGKLVNLKVHRLIAMAFLPNPKGLPEVDHINRNRTDNRPCNLRWCDRKINEDNKDSVDQSVAKYGVRYCEDKSSYYKAYDKRRLCMCKPDGSHSTTGALTQELYDILKPLSHKDRYFKYQELREANIL